MSYQYWYVENDATSDTEITVLVEPPVNASYYHYDVSPGQTVTIGGPKVGADVTPTIQIFPSTPGAMAINPSYIAVNSRVVMVVAKGDIGLGPYTPSPNAKRAEPKIREGKPKK